MRPQAHLDVSASQGQREAGEGKSMNGEPFVPQEGAKRIEYGPLQRDVRVDAMKRSLAETDWSGDVKRTFLAFAQGMADLSLISRTEKLAGIFMVRTHLEKAADLVSDDVERRVLIYLTRTLTTLEDFVRLETYSPKEREPEQRDSLDRARQHLELASRASELVEESKRESLRLLCAWVESEVVTAERAMRRPDDSTATLPRRQE